MKLLQKAYDQEVSAGSQEAKKCNAAYATHIDSFLLLAIRR